MLRNMKHLIFIFIAVLAMGCAKETGDLVVGAPFNPGTETPLPGEYVPPGGSVSEVPGAVWESGATASLDLEGTSLSAKAERLSEYSGSSRNNPTNIVLNVNLVTRGEGYGGRISIGYDDDGVFHEGVFVNGDDYVFWNTSLTEAAKYNIWFEKGGDPYFHGFFQDREGGVIIVIEGFESLGDGAVPTKARGSVWFKNFDLVQSPYQLTPPLPPTHCWLISVGPYDCRSWTPGNGVNSTESIHPTESYKKLGSFSGLDLKAAFNNDELEIF